MKMFLNSLNNQNTAIKYTLEEEINHTLNFLDISITNTKQGTYDFKIHRKEAITNVQLKPSSNINPSIFRSVFKGFLCRAKRICSLKHIEDEVNFLIQVFVENGHNEKQLKELTNSLYEQQHKNEKHNT